MKKVLMFCVVVLFFACNKDEHRVTAVYYIKNTSNQTIGFDVTTKRYEPLLYAGNAVLKNDSVVMFSINANDSIFFAMDIIWDNLQNHPNWFTKFEINPVDGIQMNDPYLPANWVEYYHTSSGGQQLYGGDYKSVPTYLFTLNKE